MEKIAQQGSDSGNGGAAQEQRIPVFIRLPRSVAKAVRLAAAERECSRQRVIEDALRAFLGMGEAA